MLRVDGESAISTEWFHSKINAEGIILDTTGAGEAVTVVERKIRQIKERFRGISNTLPYKLTETLETWLVKYVVSRIVLVPTKNSIEFVSPREKLWGRRINVDKELKHGFGEYVQVHTSQVDNTMNERTSGALSLMPSGNLEGSWYYYLLINNQVVKRNKATPIPITDDIISFMNNKSIGRKGKFNKPDIPQFERGIKHTIIDDIAYDSDIDGPDQSDFVDDVSTHEPPILLDNINIEDEYSYDIESINDVPVDNYNNEHIPENSQNDLSDDSQFPIDSSQYADILHETNIRGDNQALLDSIFGIDDDYIDETSESSLPLDNTSHTDIAPYTVQCNVQNEPIYIDAEHVSEQDLESSIPINVFTPRRSGRNHQLNRWNKRTVGIISSIDPILRKDRLDRDITITRHNFMKRTFSLNMTVNQAIKKLGYTAIYSVVKEMIQLSDLDVLHGVRVEDLTQEQTNRIITSSMFLKEKFTADGVFEKLKARLVAGGHLQDRDIYNDGSSPTLSTSSLFILSAIASKDKAVAAIDFPGAFLNSVMPEVGDHVVLMRLNKFLTSVRTYCN